jgi:hypothetical protein
MQLMQASMKMRMLGALGALMLAAQPELRKFY